MIYSDESSVLSLVGYVYGAISCGSSLVFDVSVYIWAGYVSG